MSDIELPPIEEVVDPEFDALLAKLRPVLEATARAAITEAVAAVPVPVKRPGSVQGIDPAARTASVLVDGDTTAIVAQCITELPGLYDRVMVEFNPSGAVFVVGNQSAGSFPAGFIAPYCGAVTAHAGAVPSSATSGEPPRGWLWCAGQAVNRADYAALFAAIGTTYNTGGEAVTTFRVPDFRGRIPVGLDNMGGSDAGRLSSANTLATTGGAETHSTVIAHTHSTPAHSHAAGTLAVASHTHSTPNHQHAFGTGNQNANHSHGTGDGNDFLIEGSAASVVGGSGVDVRTNTGNESATHTHSGTTNNDGSGTSGSAAPSLSGSTASDGSGTSGSTGTGSTVNHMPPFVSIHWLIKS